MRMISKPSCWANGQDACPGLQRLYRGAALSAEMTTERGGCGAANAAVAHVVDDSTLCRRSISMPQQLRPEVCAPLCAHGNACELSSVVTVSHFVWFPSHSFLDNIPGGGGGGGLCDPVFHNLSGLTGGSTNRSHLLKVRWQNVDCGEQKPVEWNAMRTCPDCCWLPHQQQ